MRPRFQPMTEVGGPCHFRRLTDWRCVAVVNRLQASSLCGEPKTLERIQDMLDSKRSGTDDGAGFTKSERCWGLPSDGYRAMETLSSLHRSPSPAAVGPMVLNGKSERSKEAASRCRPCKDFGELNKRPGRAASCDRCCQASWPEPLPSTEKTSAPRGEYGDRPVSEAGPGCFASPEVGRPVIPPASIRLVVPTNTLSDGSAGRYCPLASVTPGLAEEHVEVTDCRCRIDGHVDVHTLKVIRRDGPLRAVTAAVSRTVRLAARCRRPCVSPSMKSVRRAAGRLTERRRKRRPTACVGLLSRQSDLIGISAQRVDP